MERSTILNCVREGTFGILSNKYPMSRDYRTLLTVPTLLYFTYRALNILYAIPAWELCRYYKHVGRSYIDAIRTFPVPMEILPYRREK